MQKIVALALLGCSLLGCSGIKKQLAVAQLPQLRFLSSIEIPYNYKYNNTAIGGLSSIDYDASNNCYYFLSDDRSIVNPARYYTATINLSNNLINSVDWTSQTELKDPNNNSYTNWNLAPSTSIDPEELRYNPTNKTIVWTSEGARVLNNTPNVLQNPAIQTATLKGITTSTYPLPQNLYTSASDKGPRNNAGLEALAFDPQYKTLYTALEEPLIEDDTQANLTKGGLVRLYRFDTKTQKNTAQYAYQIDPVAQAPMPENGFMVNGISTMAYYKPNQLWVVERSYSTGNQACTIKIYLCKLAQASRVEKRKSLQNSKLQLAEKKLILNLNSLGIFIDNIEGITFGPKLANGKASVLMVSDNNFSDKQKTQILLFEVD